MKILPIIAFFYLITNQYIKTCHSIVNIDLENPALNPKYGVGLFTNLELEEKGSAYYHIAVLKESNNITKCVESTKELMTLASQNDSLACNFLDHRFYSSIAHIQRYRASEKEHKRKLKTILTTCWNLKDIYIMPNFYFDLCKAHYKAARYTECLYYSTELHNKTNHPLKYIFYGLSALRLSLNTNNHNDKILAMEILKEAKINDITTKNFVLSEIQAILGNVSISYI